MQAPRNWRNNTERYQLTVNKDQNGNPSIVGRPESLANKTVEADVQEAKEIEASAA